MKNQKGSTLIIVLIVLLLVTIIGTVAVKTSILGLGLATNDQVNVLLLENSDSALFNLENPQAVSRQLASDGVYGFFNSGNSDVELVYCYRQNQTKFFSMDLASTINENGAWTKSGTRGYCSNSAGSYSSVRNAVITQVYVRKSQNTVAPLSNFPKGTSAGSTGLPVVKNTVSVTVISVLPRFTSITDAQLNGCFKKTAIENRYDRNCRRVFCESECSIQCTTCGLYGW